MYLSVQLSTSSANVARLRTSCPLKDSQRTCTTPTCQAGRLEGAPTSYYHAPVPSQDKEFTLITTTMIMHLPADITFTHFSSHHSKWVQAEAHCLKLVAEVDLGSQDLEQDDHLLIDALAILRHQRQNLHGRMLAPLISCDSHRPDQLLHKPSLPLQLGRLRRAVATPQGICSGCPQPELEALRCASQAGIPAS